MPNPRSEVNQGNTSSESSVTCVFAFHARFAIHVGYRGGYQMTEGQYISTDELQFLLRETAVAKNGVALMLAQRRGLGETGAFGKRIELLQTQGLGLGEKPWRKIPPWERRREGRRAYLRERRRPSAREQARLSQGGTLCQIEGNSQP